MGDGRRGAWAEAKRALYPDGRPTEEAKAVHRRFVAGPIPRVVPTACVLEVVGRRTGALVRVPLVIVRYRGAWYVASMFGDRANWVRNVRAAGGRVTLIHGRRRPVQVVEVPPAAGAPILRRYLFFAPGARPHVAVRWNDPLGAFEAVADRYPVFRLDAPAARAERGGGGHHPPAGMHAPL